jgi:transposase
LPGTFDTVPTRLSAKGVNIMMVQDKKCYIGIDVSKALLDVYILPYKKYMQFKNNAQGIQKLCDKLKSFSQAPIVMEATGGYEKLVTQLLQKANFKVSVINPRLIRNFKIKQRFIFRKWIHREIGKTKMLPMKRCRSSESNIPILYR